MPEQHPRQRGLVRRADLLPRRPRRLGRGHGTFEVALRDSDLAEGELQRPFHVGRAHAVDPILVCDLLELGCRRARPGQLAGRERDLDLGG